MPDYPLLGWGASAQQRLEGLVWKSSGPVCGRTSRDCNSSLSDPSPLRAHSRQKPHLRKAPSNRGPQHLAAGVPAV